jgi:tripartite-type tricarboxylate transporter receptor subunit TctC
MEEVAMKTGVKLLHVPFKGLAEGMQALLGGHVMAQSDSTGWGRQVDAGQARLLVTFGEKRTKWDAPTAKEFGFDIVSYSPYGLVGPKGMEPQVVRALHDAFKKTLDDPEHLKTLAQLDQVYWYKSSEDYARWAAETLAAERATIERVGLLAK